MKLLDLFSGAGGAGMGYHRAGWDVVGVDLAPQPDYPFEFVQANALDVLGDHAFVAGFDAIHASPPCQAYSTGVTSRSSQWNHTKGRDEPALIGEVHQRLVDSGLPWVIENVMGARMHMPGTWFVLCGAMFARPIPRHRVFSTSWYVQPLDHPDCRGLAKESAVRLGWEYRDMSVTGKGRRHQRAVGAPAGRRLAGHPARVGGDGPALLHGVGRHRAARAHRPGGRGMSGDPTGPEIEALAASLLETDALTPNHDGTPDYYVIEAENVEHLVRTVLELDAERRAKARRYAAAWNAARDRAALRDEPTP